MADPLRNQRIAAALVTTHIINTFPGERSSEVRLNFGGGETFRANAEWMDGRLGGVYQITMVSAGSSATSFQVNDLQGDAYSIRDANGVHIYDARTGTAVIGNQPHQLTVTKKPPGSYDVRLTPLAPGISLGTKAELAVAAAKFIDLGPNFRWQTFDAPGLPSRQMVTLNTSQGPVPARVTRVGSRILQFDTLRTPVLPPETLYLVSNVTHPTAAGGSSGWRMATFLDGTSFFLRNATNTDGYVIDTGGLGNAQLYTSTGVSYPAVVSGSLVYEIIQGTTAGRAPTREERDLIGAVPQYILRPDGQLHEWGLEKEPEVPWPHSCPGGKHKKHHRKH